MALFALSHAAPFEAKARQFFTDVIFQGAPPEAAFFTQSFPVDGSLIIIGISTPQKTDDPLSISHIEVVDGVYCIFYGIDGSTTVVQGPGVVDVGPPQTQVSGQCFYFVE